MNPGAGDRPGRPGTPRIGRPWPLAPRPASRLATARIRRSDVTLSAQLDHAQSLALVGARCASIRRYVRRVAPWRSSAVVRGSGILRAVVLSRLRSLAAFLAVLAGHKAPARRALLLRSLAPSVRPRRKPSPGRLPASRCGCARTVCGPRGSRSMVVSRPAAGAGPGHGCAFDARAGDRGTPGRALRLILIPVGHRAAARWAPG
jgi:hypothetical protein